MRKTKKADLEGKKFIFLEIGFIIALLIVMLALEYKSYEKSELSIYQKEFVDIPEDIVPITEQKVKPPPPPPPTQTTKIKIVDDDVEVEEEIEIDVEADDNTEMVEYIYEPIEEEEEIDEQEIFTVVESSPEFPGGVSVLYKYLGDNIDYPVLAKELNITGRVFINFVVEPDGSISNVKVLRGIGGGCDEEAIRIVTQMPKWTPGKQRGRPVRVSFNLPVKFTLL